MQRARWRLMRLHALAALAVAVVGACSGSPASADTAPPSSPPTPAATVTPVASPTPAATATPSPVATQPAQPSPEPTLPSGPPAAVLTVNGRTITGDPGSFTWSQAGMEFGSDGPWLPGEDAGAVAAGARVEVAFEPDLRVRSWSIRAAPANQQGEPATPLASGSGAPVTVEIALEDGSWELQLEVELGSTADDRGRGSATYYWRLDVG
ncbi:MAG TPA: hypothetical protein VFK54_10420 [Candidatus Limnocylindrales bacterium]|nr:hypothetical protein [Candidatus Limnocylindrales bacterium]